MEGVVSCPACGVANRLRPAASGAPHCGSCGGALPWLVETGASDWGAVVERSPLPVLVDFWAPWCGPCRMVAPAVEEASRRFAGKLKVVKVNTDLAPELGARFGVQGIPTLMVLKGGAVAERVSGALPRPQLLDWIEAAL